MNVRGITVGWLNIYQPRREGINYSTTMSWVHAKVSFAFLRSALLCSRGSRYMRRDPLNITDNNFEIVKKLREILGLKRLIFLTFRISRGFGIGSELARFKDENI